MNIHRFPLPLIEVFATQTRRDVLAYLVEEAQADGAAGTERQWHTLGDIADGTTISRESLRKELSAENNVLYLIELGLVAVKDPDANIRHYQLADTQSAQLLYENDHLLGPLSELLGYTVRQELVTFFLDQADPEAGYTQYALNEQTGISYEALRNHIDTLVEYEIVTAQEGTRSTEYQIADSPMVTFCYVLNDGLAEQFGA
jgi:DNA-binding transcriptional ArsR family regulator